jgi:hypothetical protein
MAAIYSKGVTELEYSWLINFTKRDALSSVYKISMGPILYLTEFEGKK